MAANTSTISFDVHDCKVYPVTADATGGITYGAAVDVPGIQEVSVEPNFISVELKGDGKVLAHRQTLLVTSQGVYRNLSYQKLMVGACIGLRQMHGRQ